MNLTMFLAAGFETVYNALNYCFHVLATHPDEMKKLQEEIDTLFSDETVT
jgi:cytochrome P450